ncbi:sugar transferase (plasmid) [Salipiger sp. H15]|uniref:Sugar transferase n=1 Tax=Alloyangia sp. H15 TaxID=3029062 RepID=A0AAU8APP2_9RHOB
MNVQPDPDQLQNAEFAPLNASPRAGHPGWSTAALLASDVAVLCMIVGIARAAGAETEVRLLELSGAVLILFRAGAGLLPGFGLHHEARLRKALSAWAGAALVGLLAALIVRDALWADLLWFLLGFSMVGLAQSAASRAVRGLLSRHGVWGEPVHLDGDATAFADLRDWLAAHPEMGMTPVAVARTARKLLWVDRTLPGPETLAALGQRYSEVVLVHDLPKLNLSGLHPAALDGGLGLRVRFPHPGRGSALLKRLVDLALTIPLTLIALPLIGLAALAIKLADPGPAFFVQEREGLDGKPFGTLKLRTMYLKADDMLQELLARDPAARAEWESHFKLRDDPRILRGIGKVLRSTSLDELPQLFNILRGEMSLVGPRPFPLYHIEAMPPAFRARRATVMPGLTGLWQISERSDADLRMQQQLDEHYIAGRSFWADLSIFLRTFAAVFRRGGAY